MKDAEEAEAEERDEGEGEEEAVNYAVEKVVAVGRVKRDAALHYKCKWEGFDDSHNSWVHKQDMGVPSIREFEEEVPDWKQHMVIGIACGCKKAATGACIPIADE